MIIGKRIKYAKVTNSKSSIKVPATNAVVKSKIIVIIAGGRFVLSDKNLINFVNNTFIFISNAEQLISEKTLESLLTPQWLKFIKSNFSIKSITTFL